MDIKGFLQNSFVDWPGKIAAVVFLPGCNYRCPYCHNHRLVTNPQLLSTFPESYVLEKLKGQKDWIDGVCVTGGEPTIHADLPELLEKIKALGFAVKLDTNGSRPEVIGKLIEDRLVDAFSMDLKAPFESIPYRRNGGPGAEPEPVAQSLEIIAESSLPLELRTTVHPSLLSLDELKRMIADVREIAGRDIPVKLQRCRVDEVLDPALKKLAPLDEQTFDKWSRELPENPIPA